MHSAGVSVSVALVCICWMSPGEAAEFLKHRAPRDVVAVKEIKADLQLALAQALGHGHGREEHHLEQIEHGLSTTFKSLPKNSLGLLEQPALHYLINDYFIKEYGWHVKGLELHSANVSMHVNETAGLLKDMVPSFIEELLKSSHEGGFALRDAVAMVATMERLVFDEGVNLLQSAYRLRGLATNGRYDLETIGAVLDSYMVLYLLDTDPNNSQRHLIDVERIRDVFPSWDDSQAFLRDVLQSSIFHHRHGSNPFTDDGYSFDDAWRALDAASRQFGRFQDNECQDMKEALVGLDPESTGRVPLKNFYKRMLEGQFPFSESEEYLSVLGAIDNTVPHYGSQVIIANYMGSMNNCIMSGPYYSVCCLNECTALMDHLEAGIASPTGKPEQILALVENMPSSTVDAPRNLSAALSDTLAKVSELHGGEVPLHGRLFAQWMHYAFPHECPYPHTSTSGVAPLTPAEFTKRTGSEMSVSRDDLVKHLKSQHAGPAVHMSQWTMDEELRVGTHGRVRTRKAGALTNYVVAAAHIGTIACFAIALWQKVKHSLLFLSSTHTEPKTKEHLV